MVLLFAALTNGQTVMHYILRHHLMALLAYVTALVYTSTNDRWACSACPLVSLLKT